MIPFKYGNFSDIHVKFQGYIYIPFFDIQKAGLNITFAAF